MRADGRARGRASGARSKGDTERTQRPELAAAAFCTRHLIPGGNAHWVCLAATPAGFAAGERSLAASG